LALAQAVVQSTDEPVDLAALAPRLHQANATVWGRARDEQRSSSLDDLFDQAGLTHDPELLQAYYDFWVPHTATDPDVGPLFRASQISGRRASHNPLSNIPAEQLGHSLGVPDAVVHRLLEISDVVAGW